MNLFPWSKSKNIPVQYSNNEKYFSKDKDIETKNSFEEVYLPKVVLEKVDTKYFLEVQMGNVSIDNIDIDFYRNTLTIRGLRNIASDLEEYGAFASNEAIEFLRSDIPFDEEIMKNKIKAKFKSGVLYIELEEKINQMQ